MSLHPLHTLKIDRNFEMPSPMQSLDNAVVKEILASDSNLAFDSTPNPMPLLISSLIDVTSDCISKQLKNRKEDARSNSIPKKSSSTKNKSETTKSVDGLHRTLKSMPKHTSARHIPCKSSHGHMNPSSKRLPLSPTQTKSPTTSNSKRRGMS
jgi:hypothetical protein